MRSASTLALSTDDEGESGGRWLHPGVSPPGDAVLQLDDESNSVLESGCMFSSKFMSTEYSVPTQNRNPSPKMPIFIPFARFINGNCADSGEARLL